jgi:hypothetical protein
MSVKTSPLKTTVVRVRCSSAFLYAPAVPVEWPHGIVNVDTKFRTIRKNLLDLTWLVRERE